MPGRSHKGAAVAIGAAALALSLCLGVSSSLAADDKRPLTRQESQGMYLPYGGPMPAKHLVSEVQEAAALKEAYTYSGVPYVWGGDSRTGIDCSGLIVAAYDAAVPGLLLQSWDSPASPDATALDLYYYNTEPLSVAELRAGDLVFMTNGSGERPVTHVTMVKAVDGKAVTFIDATTRYGRVVEETWLTTEARWKKAFVGAGRLLYTL